MAEQVATTTTAKKQQQLLLPSPVRLVPLLLLVAAPVGMAMALKGSDHQRKATALLRKQKSSMSTGDGSAEFVVSGDAAANAVIPERGRGRRRRPSPGFCSFSAYPSLCRASLCQRCSTKSRRKQQATRQYDLKRFIVRLFDPVRHSFRRSFRSDDLSVRWWSGVAAEQCLRNRKEKVTPGSGVAVRRRSHSVQSYYLY